MNISKILETLRPGEQWALSGDDYTGLVWLSKTPKPTEQEIVDAWRAVQAAIAENDAKQARHAAYIAEADPLFFGWQRGENTEADWTNKVAEIRARYPYPT